MPVGQQYDFVLKGKGYMLARADYKGRAWSRTGRPDTPGNRSATDAQWGMLPDEVEHAEVWNDWSGGFGEGQRSPGSNKYDWAENCDSRFNRMLIHSQLLTPLALTSSVNTAARWIMDVPIGSGNVHIGDLGEEVIAIHNNLGYQFLYPRMGPDQSAFTEHYAATYPGNIGLPLGRPAVFGENYYVPTYPTGTFYWTTPLINGVVSPNPVGTHAPMYGHAFAVAKGFLWRGVNQIQGRRGVLQALSDTSLSQAHDPASWTATYMLGDGYSGIRDMIGYEDQIFVGGTDGLYAGDSSGTFVNVTPELGGGYGMENFRDLTVHEGQIVFTHTTGMFAYDVSAGITREIGLNTISGRQRAGYGEAVRLPPPIPPGGPSGTFPGASGVATARRILGRWRCVHSYAGWLYAGMYTADGNSYIFAGKETWNGWQWHPFYRLPDVTRVSRIKFDSANVGSGNRILPSRLWVMTDASVGGPLTGTAPVYFARMPTVNGNPLTPDGLFSANYVSTFRMDMGSTDWGSPGTPKVYRSLEVWADSLATGNQYANIYYDLDSSGSFALLGRVQESPKSELFFPAATGSFVVGQSIQLSLRSFTASPGITPVYHSIVLRGALRPKSVDQITAVVRIADGLRDRRGAPMRNANVMLTDLRALAVANMPVQLIDLAGATAWVGVQAPIEEQETYQAGEENPEIAATVRMSVMAYS